VPIITLTTDFGLADHYVGTLKGVLLSGCPEAQIVDITHDIPPFALYAGAYAISQAAPYFPPGTIHVVVIDPGVGTSRKPLLVEALGQIFIAPDNGVLSLIVARDSGARLREASNRRLWLPGPSSTFHGRDVFAPLAAAIASGAARPEDAGPKIAKIESLPGLEPIELEPGVWRGKVLSVDRFGNLITNFKAARGSFSPTIGDSEITEFRQTFGEAAEGLVFAYPGSSGYLEVGMNRRSTAALLRAAPGDNITLRLRDTIS
jgi:S-adenosylmethionine hydrolase